MRNRKGFVIILVLAFLVLLAMLAYIFIRTALIDRNIARNYMDNKRAKLIAQSGVDYALARLQESNPFDLTWQYDELNPELNPSFKAGEVTINGQIKGYSQIAGSTYMTGGDLFVLKIDDSQSRININDGLVNRRVRANLARIINNLAKIIDPSFPNLGFDIIGNDTEEKRPQGGYTTVGEIKRMLSAIYGATGENYYMRLRPFITTHAWQDPNVANPVPLSGTVVNANIYPVRYNTNIAGQNIYRYGRGYDSNRILIPGDLQFAPDPATPASYNHAIYGLDELNPQWIEIVSRSPVNINTARREVLIALLQDLKGFFVSDRRRNSPYYLDSYDFTSMYSMTPCFNYSPPAPVGDELGFLYTTLDIDTPLATTLAQEIENCQNNAGTYATRWFGGKFKTWRQFNAFCDNLVENILIDRRTITGQSIFYENDLTIPGSIDSPEESEVARRQASQAMADCLKANFNPNLHLNETNPDANIKTLVDKTDLIVNSTEFCFTPMGYFEIESTGYILKDKGTDNFIIAKQKIDTVVQIFDCYRETNQKQFLNHINNLTDYNNFIGQDSAPTRTNNSRTIQIGPEPEHIFDGSAPIAKGNEWGGYISLPTLKGPAGDTAATLYSHFTNNFTADYHADGATYQPNSTSSNVADRTESGVPGPYTYNANNRLARSFKKESDINTLRAPADLRIDGVYVERHAAIGYGFNQSTSRILIGGRLTWVLNTGVFPRIAVTVNGIATVTGTGMACYWVKPWFHPEITGKPRAFFSVTRVLNYTYFANFFIPSHWPSNELQFENNTLVYTLTNPGYAYRTTSLIFCQSVDGGYGHTTPVMNHLSHFYFSCHPAGTSPKTNYLKSGQWIHVASIWNLPYAPGGGALATPDPYRIQINGSTIDGSTVIQSAHYGSESIYFLAVQGAIWMGEPSIGDTGDWKRNFTCDSTVDEFYIFAAADTTTLSDINRSMYQRGRYYKLDSSISNETSYISGDLSIANDKNTPSNSTIESPSATGLEGTVSTTKTKVIGLSWTYYGEDVNADGNPLVKNYRDPASVPEELAVKFKVSILKDKTPLPGATDLDQDEYSSLDIEMDSTAQYSYKVTFKIEYDPANPNKDPLTTVLLTTPVFDDITIYYTRGIEFLSYS